MEAYENLYKEIYNWKNLVKAWQNARKGKTKRDYVVEFERNLRENLLQIQRELLNKTYSPLPLKTFILRDPKTRKISKSAFRDRVVHHALVRVIEPIFDKAFIYDSCANRVGKGNLFALNRFYEFKGKVSQNNTRLCFVLKADIKHYFAEVNHKILINILERKIEDEKVIWLIEQILNNTTSDSGGGERLHETKTPFEQRVGSRGERVLQKGMPLGNLTSQFLANVYLNDLDYFIKNILRIKYYIRYVDDFVILHESKEQLKIWMKKIDIFLREKLKIELHPQKSKIISLSRGVDFVGFRNFSHFKLLRKRNIRNMKLKIDLFKKGIISKEKFLESLQGWGAYAKWANSYKLRKSLIV